MTQDTESVEARPEPPPLKVAELTANEKEPWSDDVLERKQVAERLTKIIEGQEAPFVISVDGGWGTGKTFLLNRWRQDLENHEWQAIYYNAWEDDFSDDPLLAILAQLQRSLEKGKFSSFVEKIVEAGRPLIRPAASMALTATTGVPLPTSSSSAPPEDRFGDYRWKKERKDELKQLLRQMAEEVAEDSSQPLVFIIDELDRCRPTFAIELLERVKHIFDVPNIVFVFGINRAELTKSLRSIYGEIDAGVYLRRFFDMEFMLPEPDPTQFCSYLLRKFRLDAFFSELSESARSDQHSSEFREVSDDLPVVLANMGLSLRDMDYCVRLLALTARSLNEGYTIYPAIFALLVALKVANPELYRRFSQQGARGAEVMDFFNSCQALRPPDDPYLRGNERHLLNLMEAAVYCADDAKVALTQLMLLEGAAELTEPEYLSAEVRGLNPKSQEGSERLQSLKKAIQHYSSIRVGYSHSLRSLTQRIDLYYGMTRLPGT